MRLTTRQTGIISYAGLDEDALWAAAKRIFAQSAEPVPERFRSFLPIFPVELVQTMSYVGRRERGTLARVSPAGFSTDPDEYHRLLCAQMPELYAGDNYLRNFDAEGRFRGGGVVAVDRAWVTAFPQYQPFFGERLVVYMIGGGPQAVAVPESVYPRGGGVLEGAERELRVTARCAHYTAFLKTRLEMGEKYDPAHLEEEYLRLNELNSVCIRQKDLGRVMQDLCIIRDLDGTPEAGGLYTLNAKRAEGVRQYVPWRYACDTFEESPVTRLTARLLQPVFEDDAPGDLWLPYQDAAEYIDRQRMTLDMRALCEGFQIAPAYDPATHGGRYPTSVRVAVVRDRGLRPLTADALNNPAYGSGMSPLGMLNKLVYLPDSRELLRQNRLTLEPVSLTCENTAVPQEAYRRMRAMARWQEWKGRLVDALYRRESALSQLQAGSPAYDRANELLSKRVDAIESEVTRAAVDLPGGQLSGYDADIDYLRRMWRHRECVPQEEQEPVLFAPDALREQCIESGYAMRATVKSFALKDLLGDTPDDELLPQPPLPQPVPETPPVQKDVPPVQKAVPAKSSKPKKVPRPSPVPRFEQIDMFSATQTPSVPPVEEKPSLAPQQASTPTPEPYVVRSLTQLTNGKGAAPVAMMARLLKEKKSTNNDPDGRT